MYNYQKTSSTKHRMYYKMNNNIYFSPSQELHEGIKVTNFQKCSKESKCVAISIGH